MNGGMSRDEALALGIRWAGIGVPALPIAISWDAEKNATNKRPLTAHSFYDATTDAGRLRQQFEEATLPGDACWGVGLHLGPRGWMALDVDVKNGARGEEELAALEKEHGRLPDTPRVTTASGGVHIWLAKGDRHVDNTDLVPGHIEVRSDSGFVSAPGVRTPWGRWDFDDVTGDVLEGTVPAPAATWIFDRLAAGGAGRANGHVGHWRPVDEAALHPGNLAALRALRRLGGHGEFISSKRRDDGSVEETIRITRPGKKAGNSASTGYTAPGAVKVFTGNWCLFEPNRPGPRLHDNATYDADHLAGIANAVEAGDRDLAERLADPLHWARAERQAPGTASDGTPWPELVPLLEAGGLPSFPLHVYPDWLCRFVAAAAEATQAPSDLAAVLAIPVLSTVLAGRAAVEIRSSHHEPVNTYTAGVARSGEAKSPVFALLTAPLRDLEAELIEAAQEGIREAKAKRDVCEAKLKAARKGGDEARILEAQKGFNEAVVPLEPLLLVQDNTPEALADAIFDYGRLALLDDEGGEVFELMSRYNQRSKPVLGPFLRAYDGNQVREGRIGRGRRTQDHPLLTLGLTVQPSVIADIGEERGFRDRGLVPRFAFSWPPTRVGTRKTWPPVPQGIKEGYSGAVMAIGRLGLARDPWGGSGPHVLKLDTGAQTIFETYRGELERRQLPYKGDLADVAEWASKHAARVARYAGLLHVAWHKDDPWSRPVDAVTMRRAIEVSDYFIPHSLYVMKRLGLSERVLAAQDLSQWLQAHRHESFSRRDALRARPRLGAVLDGALKLLVEHGHIRRVTTDSASEAGEKTGGRPPGPTYEVNPALYENVDVIDETSADSSFVNFVDDSEECGSESETGFVNSVNDSEECGSEVSDVDVDLTADAESEEAESSQGWSEGPVVACISCGQPTFMRDPAGRARHTGCPVEAK